MIDIYRDVRFSKRQATDYYLLGSRALSGEECSKPFPAAVRFGCCSGNLFTLLSLSSILSLISATFLLIALRRCAQLHRCT